MRRAALKPIVSIVAVAIVLCFGLAIWSPWNSGIALGIVEVDPPQAQASTPQEALDELQGSGANLSADDVASLWEAVSAAGTQGGWDTWGVVVDSTTGETLLAENVEDTHTPASIVKLLTAFTAMRWLDSDDTLETGASLAGSTLYLWGEGDLLLAEGSGNSSAVSGRAGLADLAEATAESLAAQQVTSVALVYQDSLFDGETKYEGWVSEDVYNYAGGVGPYAIDTGRVSEGAWEFVDSSSVTVAAAFAASLEEQGITVTSVTAGEAGTGATDLATVSSATVREQINYLLVNSDNTLAEQYCRLAAVEAGQESSFAGATSNVISTLEAAGISTEGLAMDDCSGLMGTNRVSAQTYVDLFQLAAESSGVDGSSSGADAGDSGSGGSDEADGSGSSGGASSTVGTARVSVASTAKDLVRLLGLGGVNGTLADRFTSGAGFANVQAKTGSLGVCATLAGVVTTESGHVLMFAIGNDNVPGDASYYTRGYLDDFITALAEL